MRKLIITFVFLFFLVSSMIAEGTKVVTLSFNEKDYTSELIDGK